MSLKRKAGFAVAAAVAGSAAYMSYALASGQLLSEPPPAGVANVNGCRGGQQEAVHMVTNDAAVVRGEGALAGLPGGASTLNYNVPAGDDDLFVVTFSSESRLAGAGPGDRLELQVLVDGVPMYPFGPNTFIEGTPGAMQNAGVWCKRVGAGFHTVQVLWSVTDAGANNVVTAQLDDTALKLEVSD